MKDKVNKDEIGALTTDKLSKDELGDLLPDLEAFELKIKDVIRDDVNAMRDKIYDQLRIWDSKLISLRKELDVERISRLIMGKADAKPT